MKKVRMLTCFWMVLSVNPAQATGFTTDTTGHGILIVNAFDSRDMKYRNNKKELFAELADSLKSYLYNALARGKEPVITILPELQTNTSSGFLQSLLDQHGADIVLVIVNLNVFFEQTDVDVSKNDDGSKSRVASYDICSAMTYKIYHPGIIDATFEERNCRFFTKRNVASGILAGGPDVVGKKKYTYDIVKENAFNFIDHNRHFIE